MKAAEAGWFPRHVGKLEENESILHACDAFEGLGKDENLPDGASALQRNATPCCQQLATPMTHVLCRINRQEPQFPCSGWR
jgi:hypothetical protein